MKEVPEFYCPTDESHDIVDHDKSNENWVVRHGKCPVCGAQPKFRMVKNRFTLPSEGKANHRLRTWRQSMNPHTKEPEEVNGDANQ